MEILDKFSFHIKIFPDDNPDEIKISLELGTRDIFIMVIEEEVLEISSNKAKFVLVLGFHKHKEFFLEKTIMLGLLIPGSNCAGTKLELPPIYFFGLSIFTSIRSKFIINIILSKNILYLNENII